jgi:hypothetical protein
MPDDFMLLFRHYFEILIFKKKYDKLILINQENYSFINDNLSGKLVILANADIYFDDTLAKFYDHKKGEIISLNNHLI